MAAPEITPYGLTIQTFDEAFAALAQEVRNALGQQIAADSPTSVIGVLNGIVARLSASNQEGLQGVYLARSLDGASGTDLDRIGQNVDPAQHARPGISAELDFLGSHGWIRLLLFLFQ